ncbi:MAG: hypothetical protein J6I54_03110 [Bacteroidaceae bacterium]|nr:hypothetical protein [Bacteroidaceae bacterium]
MTFATVANAQFVKSGGKDTVTRQSSGSEYAEEATPNSLNHEFGFYIADGMGAGYQLRVNFNQYVAWNIVDFSGMANFGFDYGQLNLRTGVRANTPAYKRIRGYADLNIGYGICFASVPGFSYYGYSQDGGTNVSHDFTLGFGVGVQVHKNIAIGYHLNYYAVASATTHWAKISFIF